MALFPEEWIQELLAKTDIVAIVGQYVDLKEKNHRFWGLCPFHGEKTSSFSVHPEKQFYYCFGCHVGGNALHFIQNIEKISFIDSVKLLAERAQMPLPNQINSEQYQREQDVRKRLQMINREAALYYVRMLSSEQGKKGREYLLDRGIQPTTMVHFGLGFSLDSWDSLKRYLLEKGFSIKELVTACVLQEKQERTYDSFRGRIMYPIINTYQEVIGFGARGLGDEQPKYINTAETPLFNKGNNLYALNFHRGKTLPEIILAEGYMDVIGLYQEGIPSAVASLGTAFTVQQARLLKRYTSRIYFAYDGDKAGQQAILRGIDVIQKEGFEIGVIFIPDGMDPDEYVRKKGKDAFELLKQNALTASMFYLKYWQSQFDMNEEQQRIAYARKMVIHLEGLSPIEQERYYRELSAITNINQHILREEGQLLHVKKEAKEPIIHKEETKETLISQQILQEEQILLKVAFARNCSKEEWTRIGAILQLPLYQQIVQKKINNASYTLEMALAECEEETNSKYIISILNWPEPENLEEQFYFTLHDIQRKRINQQIDALKKVVETEGNLSENRFQYANQILFLQKKLDQIGNSEL